MGPNASEIQQGIIHFLERKRLVEGWLSVEVADLHADDAGMLEGEVFLARRFAEGVEDADLDRVCDELARAFAEKEILIDGARGIQLRATDGFFNERAHPELGTVRTLAAWLVVTPE